MKITPITDEKKVAEIMNKGMSYKMGSVKAIIKEFVNSDAQLVEVSDISNYSSAHSARNVLTTSAKSMYIHNVVSFVRAGRVYLMKTN